jgi:hypothetical protein
MAELQARILWHSGWYDGPLNGIALCDGREHWFEAVDFEHAPAVYRYELYPLSDDEIEHEREIHACFREHVGGHTDYDENGKRIWGELRPREQWQRFYDTYPPGTAVRSYRDRDPVGHCYLFGRPT